jgi:hypothetical protein
MRRPGNRVSLFGMRGMNNSQAVKDRYRLGSRNY